MADFLVIAATLLLIKSKTLLPVLVLEPEEQEEIMDLEQRLQLYKQYKEKGKEIEQLWQKKYYLYTRTPWADVVNEFSPPPHLTTDNLLQSFKRILSEFEKPVVLKEKSLADSHSKERIQELIQKLTQGKDYNFKKLTIQSRIIKWN